MRARSIIVIIVVNWALGMLITAVLGDLSIMDLVAFAGVMVIVIPVGLFTTWRHRLLDGATLKHSTRVLGRPVLPSTRKSGSQTLKNSNHSSRL